MPARQPPTRSSRNCAGPEPSAPHGIWRRIGRGTWGPLSSDERNGGILALMATIYEAMGGAAGVLSLAHAWHARVLADEEVSHAFRHGYHPEHTERLAAYWGEALGGPSRYSERFGNETTVVKMHSGNGPHDEMDRRAIACFDQALMDTGLADDTALREALHDYFSWATTTTMARYHDSAEAVPDGLRIPRWSWDGLVRPEEAGGQS
jgi:hemoglobin